MHPAKVDPSPVRYLTRASRPREDDRDAAWRACDRASALGSRRLRGGGNHVQDSHRSALGHRSWRRRGRRFGARPCARHAGGRAVLRLWVRLSVPRPPGLPSLFQAGGAARQRTPNSAAVSPHGPAGITNPSGASFSPYGPGGGGGSGQYTTTGFPGSSEQLSGPGSPRSVPGGSAPAKPTSGPVLTAVAACVTPKGSCPMQRDLGTACQCKDQQGNLYDGIMK